MVARVSHQHYHVVIAFLYVLILLFCIFAALQNRDRFSSLLILGVGLTFFLFFAVNMSMVMGLMPVIGVPLPLVSYGPRRDERGRLVWHEPAVDDPEIVHRREPGTNFAQRALLWLIGRLPIEWLL